MATISTSGAVLDVNTLVTQLVAAERSTTDQRINRDTVKVSTEFTALATLKGAMSAFQAALNSLKGSDAFQPRKVTSGDEAAFTASATPKAAAGNYDVEVFQLATATRLGSGLFAGGATDHVGSGKLTISVGDKPFSIDIAADDTLADLRDAINGAKDNTGVRATLIRDTSGTGSYLVLTGTKTGDDNEVTVSATDTDAEGVLDGLVGDLIDIDEERDVVAQPAIVYISGYEIHSQTNTITGAIDGVTLSLKKAEADKLVSLSVERDDSTIQKRAESLVASYNALAQQIATLSRYDATTKSAGPLLGDSMLRGLDTQMRRILSAPVSGATGNYTTLASLGITTTGSGTLQLDSKRFRDALEADPTGVSQVFSAAESGVAVRMSAFLDTKLSSTGELAARDQRISTRRRELQDQTAALDARMKVLQERYMKQFSALDAMLAQMQSTSGYLSQQLTALSNLNKSS